MQELSVRPARSEAKHLLAVALVSVAYVSAWWGLLAFPGAVFWDDWTLFGHPSDSVLSQFTAAGAAWAGFINLFFVFIGPGSTRVLVFVTLLASLILWYFVMNKIPQISHAAVVFGVAIAASLPLFLAKVAAINTISTIALVIFLIGWLFLLSARSDERFSTLILPFSFLLVAGFLYSAFFFVALAPFLHFLWLTKGTLASFRWNRFLAFGLSFFVVAALVYVVSPLLFPLSGLFLGYRAIELGVGQFIFGAVGLVLIGFFSYLLLRFRQSGIKINENLRPELKVGVFALLLGWLAVLPYVLIGIFPPFQEWHTRYEINLFMSISLFAALFFDRARRHLPRLLAGVVSATLLVSAVLMSNLALAEFGLDSRKHDYIEALLNEHKERLGGRYVVFVDQSENLNAMNRSLRFYEWSAILSEATGKGSTFGDRGEDPLLSYDAYLNGRQDSYLNADYNYRWRDHDFPAELAWVRIQEEPGNKCDLFESEFSDCLWVEISFAGPENEN